MTEIARLREGPEYAALIRAAVAALPALLDRLEAAEAVAEAAREVVVHGSGTGEWTAADEVRGDALVYALDAALRRYDAAGYVSADHRERSGR